MTKRLVSQLPQTLKREKKRFSAKKVAEILKQKLKENLDVHQKGEEFVEGCLQCEKCRLIREIAMDTHNPTVIVAVCGKPLDRRRFGTRAFVRGLHGERILTRDWDKRVRGRTRVGK